MNKRYTVEVMIGSQTYQVFDNAQGKWLKELFTLEVQAQAAADALNGMAESEESAADPTKEKVQQVDKPSVQGLTPMNLPVPWLKGKREGIILGALAGKVKCSACKNEFTQGALKRMKHNSENNAPFNVGIKVTRYIGFDTDQLTVDLTCLWCEHTGLYEFSGNPLREA